MGEPTVLLVDQLRAINTDDIVGDPEDYLDPLELAELAELEQIVGRYLGL